MLKTENAEVIGWEHAIRGMRNPKNSWEKSDSNWRYVAPAQRENHILASYSDDSEFWIGPKCKETVCEAWKYHESKKQ